jgi:hypothetical protein
VGGENSVGRKFCSVHSYRKTVYFGTVNQKQKKKAIIYTKPKVDGDCLCKIQKKKRMFYSKRTRACKKAAVSKKAADRNRNIKIAQTMITISSQKKILLKYRLWCSSCCFLFSSTFRLLDHSTAYLTKLLL